MDQMQLKHLHILNIKYPSVQLLQGLLIDFQDLSTSAAFPSIIT